MRTRRPQPDCPPSPCYETLVAAEDDAFEWPEFDERTAASLCYTSGTTGHPKGALYSHRSTVLHAFGISLARRDLDLGARRGLPGGAAVSRLRLGHPLCRADERGQAGLARPRLDGASLYELFEAEGVTYALGVPTVWLGFEAYLSAPGARCSTLHRVLSGGSAVPPSMIEAFARRGIDVRQGWGMTEMSPLGTIAALKAKHRALDPQAPARGQDKAGPAGLRRRNEDRRRRGPRPAA